MNPIYITEAQISAVRTMLANENDEQLLVDTLEGETNLFELVRSLDRANEDDEGATKALNEQISERQARKQSAFARIEKRKEAISALIECAGLTTLKLPEATFTVRKVRPKPFVVDEAEVPESLCRIKRSPDMAAIRAEMEAGRAVSGVTFDNGGTSLTVRRK